MKVLVVRTGPLFAHDETRQYAEKLCKVLVTAGHSVELTTIPFSGAIADIVAETAAYRLFDLRHGADMCIGIGPFSHALKHENKRLWVFSRYSPFYELWDTPYGAVTASYTNLATREYVHAVDRAWLAEARAVCVASQTLAQALSAQHGDRLRVLPPALLDGFESATVSYGEFFLAAGPLVDTARIPLLINGFTKTVTPARLVIMGFEFTLEEREYAEQLVAGSAKADSITLEINPSYDRFRDCIPSALAFVSVPFRGSTLDLFAIAAGSSRKAILTTSDSGELALLVENRINGYSVEPNPGALAQAMDEVFGNRKSAERLGKSLSEKLNGILPSWEMIAEELTK